MSRKAGAIQWVDHRANCNRKTAKSLVEQLSVCACPHKVDGISIKLIDQQEITADMAFSVIDPLAFEWVIEPFGAKRRSLAISNIMASLSRCMS